MLGDVRAADRLTFFHDLSPRLKPRIAEASPGIKNARGAGMKTEPPQGKLVRSPTYQGKVKR